MHPDNENRSEAIVETSLSEIAFIFFFILLIFSVWNIGDTNTKLDQAEKEKKAAQQEISVLTEESKALTEKINSINSLLKDEKINPDDIFERLILAEKEAKELSEVQKRNEELSSLSEEQDKQLQKVADILEVKKKEVLDEVAKVAIYKEFEKNPAQENIQKKIEHIVKKNNDLTGQNERLREQLNSQGNGLDHPPCWFDEQGKTEFLYDIVIFEYSIQVFPGWPERRKTEALESNSIQKGLGTFLHRVEFLKATKAIFKDSVNQNCRHLVRVYDADVNGSRIKYKNLLRSIKQRFYDAERKGAYERNAI